MEPNATTAADTPVVSTAGATSGALVRVLYVERQVKGYAITASELRQIGSFNRISTLFFSLGSAAIGSAVGMWWDLASGSPSASAQTVGEALIKLFIGAGIVCYAVAGYFAWVRRNEISQILGESKSKEG